MVGTTITVKKVCIMQLSFSQELGCISKVVCWCLLFWSLSMMNIKLRFSVSCQNCWSGAEILLSCLF